MGSHHKVVVIGGGLAGISAAKTLIQNGVQDVLLIEAKDRLGGRVHTIIHDDGGPLELGAQWIHGEKGNDIADLAKQIDSIRLIYFVMIHSTDEATKREWSEYYDEEEEEEEDKEEDEEDDVSDDESGYFLSDSTPIPENLVRESFIKFDMALEEADTYYDKKIIKDNSITIGKFIENKVQGYLNSSKNKKAKVGCTNIQTIKRSLIDWRILAENVENACSSLQEIALNVWGEYYLPPGVESLELGSKGYQPIVDFLANGIPKHSIKLNTVVESLEWSPGYKNDNAKHNRNKNEDEDDDSTVNDDERLECCNRNINESGYYLKLMDKKDDHAFNQVMNNVVNSKNTEDGYGKPLKVKLNSGETVEADHVIVTLPLGVLKHLCGFDNHQISGVTSKDQNFFLPSLPKPYLHSIDKLAYGTVDKIFLEFEKPFWKAKNSTGVQFVWRRGEVLELDCLNKYGRSYENTKWYQSIQGFNTLLQHRNMLCGWVASSEAVEMERESDDLVMDVCVELLQRFSGKKMDRPFRMIRSKWALDPFSRGVYCYRKIPSSYKNSLQLARALPTNDNPRLLFAGEATHCHFYSTTHGAMATGVTQAHKIIKHYS
ncbi:hypothetical protein HELRODRAFT_191961 [Helobdella robusta]|uniref:Amine oxidase domain-containing protein n=1 Tax=Helobdella robusta TaxID=6412 RepID=T1FTG4_HELRO|nr:hypothetical protein HELRODRAFT_191961 [Helobdella robusta]ESO03800.1 hypothetical protein HELRODRAFT_191961 [Helobdella robusta]